MLPKYIIYLHLILPLPPDILNCLDGRPLILPKSADRNKKLDSVNKSVVNQG